MHNMCVCVCVCVCVPGAIRPSAEQVRLPRPNEQMSEEKGRSHVLVWPQVVM